MIIAVDPGKDAGVFVIFDGEWKILGREGEATKMLEYVERILENYPGRRVHIVGERFSITRDTAKMSRQYDAIEMIGVLRWFTHVNPRADLTLQSREVKSRVSNDALRRLGWWRANTDGHMHDAARHGLVYAAQCPGGKYDHLVKKAIGIVDTQTEENGANDVQARTQA